MTSPKTSPENSWPILLGLVAVIGWSFVAETNLPAWARYLAALAGGGASVFFLYRAERKRLAEADELELRIYAEGRSLSFNLLIAALLIWVPLLHVGAPQPVFPVLMLLVLATYVLGPWIVRRRYR